MKKFLLACTMLAATAATAGPMDFLGNLGCGDSCITVGGSALYWQPCFANYYVGQVFNDNAGTSLNNNKLLQVKNSYDWGFQVFGQINSCDGCRFARLQWTRLETSDKKVFGLSSTFDNNAAFTLSTANPAIDIEDDFLRMSASTGFEYNRVALQGGGRSCCMCGLAISFYADIEYVRIRDLRRFKGLEENVVYNTKIRTKTEGVGFGLGMSGVKELCRGFKVVGDMAFIGAVADRSARLVQLGVDVFTGEPASDRNVLINASETVCIPATDMRIGVQYSKCCCGIGLEAEIGYEINYYWSGLIDTDLSGQSINLRPTNVGFAGPYFKLAASF